MATVPIATVVPAAQGTIALTDKWTINHTPAANTQATATKAAGATGVRHVGKRISFSGAAAAAQAIVAVNVNLRDGATGAGTILWSYSLSLLAGTSFVFDADGFTHLGTAATAMTLEFSAAGGAGTLETVNLEGYDAA